MSYESMVDHLRTAGITRQLMKLKRVARTSLRYLRKLVRRRKRDFRPFRAARPRRGRTAPWPRHVAILGPKTRTNATSARPVAEVLVTVP